MKIQTKHIATIAILIALQIILSRFLSIQAWNFKIGFSFLPIALAACYLGISDTIIIAVASDVLGAILFPSGAFFIGFTITAAVTAIIYSLFLRKQRSIVNICLAVFINQIVCSLLLNTLWISILYHSSFVGLLSTRLLQAVVMIPVQIAVIILVDYVAYKYIDRVIN